MAVATQPVSFGLFANFSIFPDLIEKLAPLRVSQRFVNFNRIPSPWQIA